MVIVFDVWSFKDIQKVCSPALEEDEAREMLTYMKLEFSNNWCMAYGANGILVSRINVRCTMTENPLTPAVVYMRPVKIPAKTNKVIMNTDDPQTLILTFYDKNNEKTGEVEQARPTPGAEIDLGDCVAKAIENIEKNGGPGKYVIGVNPKNLIAALSGMKDAETVIFNFGTEVQPFTVRPYGKDSEGFEALSLVFPRRLFSGGYNL